MSNALECDVVVVGAGTAGCVVAARLSEDPSCQVVLLEAGGSDRTPYIRFPAGLKRLPKSYDWLYPVEPDPTRGGVVDQVAAGRVLGGTSSINGMTWVRGNPADFDGWAAAGMTGWDHASVQPSFVRAETWDGPPTAERGDSGPQHVAPTHVSHRLTDAFVAAAANAGFPRNPDYNAGRQTGAGYAQLSQRRGMRHSTARAYLRRATRRPNLRVVTGATATRVLLDGLRATGVEYLRDGRIQVVRSRGEVVVSAGALGSPRLLMLSGIGPAEHLRAVGVPVAVDLPGVGGNLQDHIHTTMQFAVTVRTLNRDLTPRRMLAHGLDFLLRGRGALTAAFSQALLFAGADGRGEDDVQPQLAAIFAPIGIISRPQPQAGGQSTHDIHAMKLLDLPAATIVPAVLHPRSRGTVRLRSADPTAPPLVDHPLLSDPGDVERLRTACRMVRAVMAAEPMRSYVTAEMLPGPDVAGDEQLLAWLRGHAHRAKHSAGTCAAGDGEMAVLDAALRVRGAEGLRVADASVMPSITSGVTAAPTAMIGERAAELIRAG